MIPLRNQVIMILSSRVVDSPRSGKQNSQAAVAVGGGGGGGGGNSNHGNRDGRGSSHPSK